MVRLRCEKCNNDAAAVSLVGYTETYLCEICEGKARQPSGTTSVPCRQLASLLKPDVHSDPLVCGICKISPARVFSPNDTQVDTFGSPTLTTTATRSIVGDSLVPPSNKQAALSTATHALGIQLQTATGPETEYCCDDPQLFCRYWNLESDSDSILIESPHGAIPTVPANSTLISHGSTEMKSFATSKSNDTNETYGVLTHEYPSESDVVDGVIPDGVVEGFPCGTIPVCELPGFNRNKRSHGNGRFKKRKCIKSGASEQTSSPTQRRCMHCGVLKTPQWRAGPSGQKTLCNACGVKYKAGRLSARAARGAASGRGRGRGRGRKHSMTQTL